MAKHGLRQPTLLLLVISVAVALSACGGESSIWEEARRDTATPPDRVTVHVPPGALPPDAVVAVDEASPENPAPAALEGALALGPAVRIDAGGATLSKPAKIELAFDPALLPADTPGAVPFLAYYDEARQTWVPVPGEVDMERGVIIVETDHFSWWQPWTWNWGAWIAVLNKTLQLNMVDLVEAVALLTDDCPQRGQNVSVNLSQANNVVQGCVEHDDPVRPELRIVNPKSFFFEVRPVSGGNGYPEQTVLGPGESLRFEANTADPSPLVVAAEINQKSGAYLVVHLIIQMLPGANQLHIQGPQLACITERVADVSYIASAVEALVVDKNGVAAGEQLLHMLLDRDVMRRFITAADDCGYGPALTWSVEGIKQIGSATATIVSAWDFVFNYFLNHDSQVMFTWEANAAEPGPAPSVPGHNSSEHVFSGPEDAIADYVGGADKLFGDCRGLEAAPPLDPSQEKWCFGQMEERGSTRLYGFTSAWAMQSGLGAHVFHVFVRSVDGGWIWIKPACINPDESPDLCDYDWPPG